MRSESIDIQEVIKEAKSKLGRNAAEIIVKDLNITSWDGKKGCCPIHKENTPSFIWCDEDKNGGGNFFKCFGCGITYDIISHFMRFGDLTFEKAVQKLCEMADVTYTPVVKNKDDIMKKYRYPKETHIKSRDNAEKYLYKRHISASTLNYVGIKEDANENIIFEYRDLDGTLLNVKYRPAKPIKRGRSKMWFQENADNCPALFNMHKIDTTKPLIICEGEIDCLSLIESGLTNSVSIPYGANDSKWIEFNYEWLEQFEKIILWFDNDSTGKKAIAEAIPRLGRHRTYYIDPTDEVLIH